MKKLWQQAQLERIAGVEKKALKKAVGDRISMVIYLRKEKEIFLNRGWVVTEHTPRSYGHPGSWELSIDRAELENRYAANV